MQAENDAITYTINYAAQLNGDTISSSTWSSEDDGVTIANTSNTTLVTSCRLSGDIGRYNVVNKVVTTAGDTIERFIDVIIDDNTRLFTDNDYWLSGRRR